MQQLGGAPGMERARCTHVELLEGGMLGVCHTKMLCMCNTKMLGMCRWMLGHHVLLRAVPGLLWGLRQEAWKIWRSS